MYSCVQGASGWPGFFIIPVFTLDEEVCKFPSDFSRASAHQNQWVSWGRLGPSGAFLFPHPPHLRLGWVPRRTLQPGLDAHESLVVGSGDCSSVSPMETKSWEMCC